jgi:hypothetical protein
VNRVGDGVTASWLASGSLLAALLSVTAVAVLLTASLWIAVTRPGLGMIFCFILFGFAWRINSVLYIDLLGPLFSEQLERDIGPGISALPIAMSQGLVIAALLFSFRPGRLLDLGFETRLPLSGGRFRLSELAFWAVVVFTVALWIELLVSGPIPLFAGMERFDYTPRYGGPLHLRLLDWGPMLALQLGIFFVAPTLRNGSFDRRFAILFAILLLYLFLVGHRFSSFYSYSSFFIIPIGAVLLAQEARGLSARKLFSGAALRNMAIAGIALCLLVVVAVTYSYLVVRRFEGAELLSKVSQRILVQQGEMWWMTYERVFVQGNWNGGMAAYKLFVDPFNPARNSTMQYLMELGLPLERAHFILGAGSAYAGGWPEVFFELGGPVGGFVLTALSAILFSEFMFLVVRCIVQERFATCFFLIPVLFALTINIAAGMVNSFIQVTFAIKLAVALIVYITEDRWRSGLIPAHLAESPDPVPASPKELVT